MEKQNNLITRKILILAMWFREQENNLFHCRIDIRDEPARPEPARPEPARPKPARPGHDALCRIFPQIL